MPRRPPSRAEGALPPGCPFLRPPPRAVGHRPAPAPTISPSSPSSTPRSPMGSCPRRRAVLWHAR
eukprot:2713958-Pleurochrysis_carterae.AAC.1